MATIFLHVAKAFDMVNHMVLLRKLYAVGIRDPMLNILTDYLKERRQLVKIQKNKSE